MQQPREQDIFGHKYYWPDCAVSLRPLPISIVESNRMTPDTQVFGYYANRQHYHHLSGP